jgi:hypothetical protein
MSWYTARRIAHSLLGIDSTLAIDDYFRMTQPIGRKSTRKLAVARSQQ